MKLLWLLIALVFSSQLFAADAINTPPKKLMVVNPVKSEITLSDIEKRMINKIVLKTCARQTDYQIALGEIGVAREALTSIFQVDLTLTGNENNLKISGVFLDEKNKILINKVVKERVERLHLMRNVELVMESLFVKLPKPQSLK